MKQTEFRITKNDFSVLYRSLRKSLEEDEFKYMDKEHAEYLIEQIDNKIFSNGTTRQNWQVVKYNDPAWKDHYNRQQYSHYGEY